MADLMQQLNAVSSVQDAWNETRNQLRKHQRELGVLRLEHDGHQTAMKQLEQDFLLEESRSHKLNAQIRAATAMQRVVAAVPDGPSVDAASRGAPHIAAVHDQLAQLSSADSDAWVQLVQATDRAVSAAMNPRSHHAKKAAAMDELHASIASKRERLEILKLQLEIASAEDRNCVLSAQIAESLGVW